MDNEGNLQMARDIFLRERPNNLTALLKQRYSWMSYRTWRWSWFLQILPRGSSAQAY